MNAEIKLKAFQYQAIAKKLQVLPLNQFLGCHYRNWALVLLKKFY